MTRDEHIQAVTSANRFITGLQYALVMLAIVCAVVLPLCGWPMHIAGSLVILCVAFALMASICRPRVRNVTVSDIIRKYEGKRYD